MVFGGVSARSRQERELPKPSGSTWEAWTEAWMESQ